MTSMIPLVILLSLISSTSLVSAQVASSAPVPVTGASYARSRTKLFVQGGVVTANGITVAQQNQMFALDLSVPWSANNPSWIQLKSGPTQVYHSAVVSSDEQFFVTFRNTPSGSITNNLSYRFNILANSWSQSTIKVQNPSREGVTAVKDPTSGLIYLAGGFQSDDSQMYIANLDTDMLSMFTMPNNFMSDRFFYSGVYLQSRKSIIYFGGSDSAYSSSPSITSQNLITEFVPSTGAWSNLIANNPNPAHRTEFCMTANDDGTKVVVFGGRLDSTSYARDIWVLDIPSMLWTQGPSLSEPRASAACVLAGNTFIAWGGSNGQHTVDGKPILYDVNTNQYVGSYTPPSSYASNANVFGNNPNNKNGNDNNRSGRINSNSLPDDDSGPNSMLIIAGVIGAIVAVAVAALISVYVRKRRRIEYEANLERMECGGSGNFTRRPSTSTFIDKKPSPKDGYSFDEDKENPAKPTKAHTQDSYAKRNSNQF
ncbi:hypothetical protein MVEG_10306 [Podila verticillata NRRL 6337]|nr:hypothetical protein MVEG_10306 [Podila verticillata NRRL 6337]